MATRTVSAVLALAAVFTSGCTKSEPAGDRSVGTSQTTSIADTTVAAPRNTLSVESTGRLVIRQRFRETGQFDEGSLTLIELRDPMGELVLADTIVSEYPGPQQIVDVDLAAGTYELTVTARPCGGSCEFLDPPSSRCIVVVDLSARGSDLELEIGRPCRVV